MGRFGCYLGEYGVVAGSAPPRPRREAAAADRRGGDRDQLESALGAGPGVARRVSHMERSRDVQAAFVAFLASLSGGDEAAVAHLATTGDAAALIGSDAGEWLTGAGTWAVLPAFVRAFRAAGLRVTPGEPAGYAEGPVGWASDRPSFRTEAGARTQTRMTAIF